MPRGAASSMTSIARPTGTSRVVALTAAMRRMVDGRQVRCKLDGSRTYDRCAGVCYLDGQDIAAKLVRKAFARDGPRYSRGATLRRSVRRPPMERRIGDRYRLPGYCR
jgi:endonuclease YncB( thermonuclease family)